MTQPQWKKPQSSVLSSLKIYNSLTKSKDEFLPSRGRFVGWYSCGPTVYDASHMGHARAYMTFDILRRIMEEYFGYHICYVMNITDIDDKIIIAARHKYLFESFKSKHNVLSESLIDTVESAWKVYVESKFSKYDDQVLSHWNEFVEKMKTNAPSVEENPKFSLFLKTANDSLGAIHKAKKDLQSKKLETVEQFLLACKDTISPYLDGKEGKTVTDPFIFRNFAAFWEDEYFKDMDALNIKRPDILTRVSEYVPEIITFVQKIIDNGFAYESNGSVYFDTARFDKHPDHTYAKLEPWSAGNVKLLQEGEGDLTSGGSEKKNSTDFALWKKSKEGEPAWDSPWGKGRPGWHIECSAMAGDVLGENLDIHSGGIDLAFPHHDNEIAQSEAHYKCDQWVNYFLHAGHLHIEGQKMSKSLKNFVTIQAALEKYTANQIRIMFLLHQWDSVLDFKEASMIEAKDYETKLNNFFVNVKAVIRAEGKQPFTGKHCYNAAEKQLVSLFYDKREAIHSALADSFNTPLAMIEIRNLMTAVNTYMSDKVKEQKTLGDSATPVNVSILDMIAKYITRMLKIFGLGSDGDGIGLTAVSGDSTGNKEDLLLPYLNVLAGFRDSVRESAQKKAPYTDLLNLCDKVRDEQLVELGVALDDREDGKSLIKFVDREVLLAQRQEKLEKELQKRREKEERQKQQEEKRLERLAKGKLSPLEMFKDEEGRKLYSQWDEIGMPTHGIDGEELPKSRRKKLQKEYDGQKKLHEEYLASQ